MKKALVLSDFNNIPGAIENGVWRFPTIKYSDQKGKSRMWTMYVSADLPLTMELINSSTDIKKSEYYTLSGCEDGVIRKSDSKIITAGKVKRTVIQQAMSEAYSDWRKYKEDKNKTYLSPQLLTVMEASVMEECYLQLKYNGVRCLATMKDDKFILYSRGGQIEYNLPYIAESLKELVKDCSNLKMTFDGEIYFHGLGLQDINSMVSAQDDNKLPYEKRELKKFLHYYIFDIIIDTAEPYKMRKVRLDELFNRPITKRNLVNVDSIKLPNISLEFAQLLMHYVNNKNMEGIIIRRSNRPYKEARCDNVMKLKPVHSEELIIIGYDTGVGKNANAIQWRCRIPAGIDRLTEGAEVSVVPTGEYDDRIAIYNSIIADPTYFTREYQGKKITIEFNDISSDGIPLQLRAITIRPDE